MRRSQPKPKIVYKNLEDLIKKGYPSQTSPTKPPAKPFLRENPSRINTDTNENSNSSDRNIILQNRNTSYDQKRQLASTPKFIRKNLDEPPSPPVNNYSYYFHEIDAIYTDLEDVLLKSKQDFMSEVRKDIQAQQPVSVLAGKIQEMKKMSEYIHKVFLQFMKQERIPCKLSMRSGKENHCAQVKWWVPSKGSSCEKKGEIDNLALQNNKSRSKRRDETMYSKKRSVYQVILAQKRGSVNR